MQRDAERPLGTIALSLSGGGVRAVGFHLGTLAYLERLGLLQDVTTLSTVSGGSLVGIGYAVSIKQGKSFADFYHDLISHLQAANTLELMLGQLEGANPVAPSGRRNMVTALAQVYDDAFPFFAGERFDLFWNAEPRIHLEEIIFNATEFKTGQAFRFRYSQAKAWSGSHRVSLPEDLVRKLRMADIMAASSCIPGGLEPLQFPDDFRWPSDVEPGAPPAPLEQRSECTGVRKWLDETIGEASVALMDGGVYDNQGIASVLLALRQRREAGTSSPFARARRAAEGTIGWIQGEVREAGWLPLMTRRHAPVAAAAETKDALADAPPFVLSPPVEASDRMCPVCKVPLEAVEYEGVDVDQCSRCHGVWFDEGEIEQALDEETDLGLFVISDAPLRSDPVYSSPELPLDAPISLAWLRRIGMILYALGCLSVVGVLSDFAVEWIGGGWTIGELVVELFSLGLPLMLVAGLVIALRWINGKLERVLAQVPGRRSRTWMQRVTLNDLAQMLAVRGQSLFSMSNDIFMDRIRFLGYAFLYSQRSLRHRILANEIDTLLRTRYSRGLPAWLEPSAQMTEVLIPRAAHMGTKIWTEPPKDGRRSDLETLVACGHATTCYNLIAHLWLHGRDTAGRFESPVFEALFRQAESDWKLLVRDAYALVDLGPGARVDWRPAPDLTTHRPPPAEESRLPEAHS